MTLETSERDFAARFAAYAAQGVLYPQREGSPLLEFAVAGRVLYLFDRSGPYAARPGSARVVVHGLLVPGSMQVLPPDAPQALQVLGVSAVEGQGQVMATPRGAVVVRARLPLVLASFAGLPDVQEGDMVSFQTSPPLHGFLI